MIRTCDDHQSFDQIMFIRLIHLDAFLFEIFKCTINNLDTSFDDEFSRVKLGLSLLDQEKRLSYFGVVCYFHDFHLLNFNSANFAPILKKLRHVVTNERGVSH